MKILVNVIKWKSACLLLFLFSKVELEIESGIHEFRLSELLQFTTVFLGRTSETFRTVHETGDTVHLQNLIPFLFLSLIHISAPTRLRRTSYAVFCLKKKKTRGRNDYRTQRQYKAHTPRVGTRETPAQSEIGN